jgi:hypothetical protein
MAELLLNSARVTRAIYLGSDDALEDTVALWAESLVGPDASDRGVWDRAYAMAAEGSPDQIQEFLRAERARLRLKSLENLPVREMRSVEMFGDRVAILVNDKAMLDEEDIFSATFLIYGKGDAPLAKRIGPRWFVTPGPIGSPGGGAAVLDDSGDEIVATFYGPDGLPAQTERLATPHVPKLNVKG